jgi:putative hydrolase of the HAD superfamily
LSINHVVFDVGNVIVRWAPQEIVSLTFGKAASTNDLAGVIFQSDIWKNLNKGLLTEDEAGKEYCKILGWSQSDCERFFYYVKSTQLLIYGTLDLIYRVKKAGYQVYALTDNVNEIVNYLKETYDFWTIFDGATVSAEVGSLKPQPDIYNSLLNENKIKASETIFIDDMDYNVKGAERVGIAGILFESAEQCENELRTLGLEF